MNVRFISLLASLLGVVMIVPPVLARPKPDIKGIVKANSKFAVALYRNLARESEHQNLFFSPYSISVALAMTYGGARGNTQTQMADTLALTMEPGQVHSAFQQLARQLDKVQESGDAQLLIANAIWPHLRYPFLPQYVDLLKTFYGVSITPLDFEKNPETARQHINQWVADHTQHKITQLIGPGILNALTRLVLANAIYFKGNWQTPFSSELTQQAPFYVSQSRQIQVPMMANTGHYLYGETNEVQILEMNYENGGLSMLILLPKQRFGLWDFEKMVTWKTVDTIQNALYLRNTTVFIPKFVMDSAFRLDNTLKQMGMTDAFDGALADFSGMDGHQKLLYIGAVLHKAVVEVNEKGTEAAASTAVAVATRSAAIRPPVVFRADHPFMFLIRENRTGTILFVGRVVEPSIPSNSD